MILSRRLIPGVPDLIFAIVLATVVVGGRSKLLNDPGTFWHLRLGRDILKTGAVPRFDTLTYSRANTPWVDQSWAFDVALAAIVNRWGWSGAVAVTALIIASVYAGLGRNLTRDGRSPIVAVLVGILAVGISTTHFHVRPHILTLAFVLWTARACQVQHERGGWAVAWVPLLMVPWANVHGGFLAGPVIVGTALLGEAISGPWDTLRKNNLAKFAVAFVAACLTPLVNPYGFGLYVHVRHLLLSSGVTQLIDEYQPLPFGSGRALVIEWVILGLIALPTFSTRTLSRYQAVHTVVWLHFALGSIRHAPLFALIAAPGLAEVLDGLPLGSRALGRRFAAGSVWSGVAAALLLFAVAFGLRVGWHDPKNWPLGAIVALDRQAPDLRLFHEQDWGGMIESECRPARKTFLDDRFELFGKSAIVEYVDAMHGGPRWEALRDRERFDLVWIRPDRELAQRLAADPAWAEEFRDPVSVLYRRRSAATK
jgi:hypothetical protein